ncbi:MAG: glycosyltransferase family 2 protein [Burkholderiales bacterium]|nr:glycosyltransferase family 2 protein [Burkholderiales bacterium]
MDLSIIIVNWNSKDLLAKALDAIVDQPPDLSHEIVVIDSGSFDGSAEMLSQHYPNVRFVQSRANIGFARANNAGVEHSCAPVLLFLNPDTQVAQGAIDRLYRALTSRSETAIVGARLLNSDGSLQETCVRALPTLTNQLLDSDWLHHLAPNAQLWGQQVLSAGDDKIQPVAAVSGACLMMKRDVFRQVGGFSTDYFMYAEDMDLCLKTTRAGFDICHVPSAVVVHHGGGSSASSEAGKFSAVMALESQWRYFRKTQSRYYAAVYRTGMGVMSLLRITLLWPYHLMLGGGALLWRRTPRQLSASGWSCSAALAKWQARLRWSVGLEHWVRNY